MFDDGAQVTARFPGGLIEEAEVVAALRRLGLAEEQITVIERGAPGEPGEAQIRQAKLVGGQVKRHMVGRQEELAPGLFGRLQELFDGESDRGPALTALVRLGRDEALAVPVQEMLRRLGAGRVRYYPPTQPGAIVIEDGRERP